MGKRSTSTAAGAPAVPREARVDARRLRAWTRAIDGYPGAALTRLALRLQLRTLVPTEALRHAQWSAFSLQRREWRIPATGRQAPRIVPLPRQVLELLIEIRKYSGGHAWLFPSAGRPDRPIGAAALRDALGHACPGLGGAVARRIRLAAGALPVVVRAASRGRAGGSAALDPAAALEAEGRRLQAWADWLDPDRATREP